MSSITITVLFTKNNGEPATGLTLADVAIYLRSRAKTGGAVAVVWNGENPTEEIGGGMYTRRYALADESLYEYFCWALYSGAVSLDSNYAVQASPGSSEYLYQALHKDADQTFDPATDSLEAIRDALRAADIEETLAANTIEIRRGDSMSEPIAALGSLAGRSKLWVTVKKRTEDTDSEAIIQWEETAGLVYLNGADASARAANGSITVDDEVVGTITVALDEVETDDLPVRSNLVYDVQVLVGGTVTTLRKAMFSVVSDVTRVVA